MTKAAFMKIIAALGLITLCIGACVLFDGLIPTQDTNEAHVDETHNETQNETSIYGEAHVDAANSEAYDETSEHSEAPTTKTDIADVSMIARLIEEDFSAESFARERFGISFETEIPIAFSREVLDPSMFEASYVSDTVFSFVYDGDIDDAIARCRAQLEKKGWRSLKSHERTVCNFIKSDGAYQWLNVQYLTIGAKTVLVMNTVDR